MKNFSHLNNLPKLIVFQDLHITNNFKAILQTLKGIAGVYAIINTATGAVYIGSSIDIAVRMLAHLVYNTTNVHLQRALATGDWPR
jgi:hypothetical protein